MSTPSNNGTVSSPNGISIGLVVFAGLMSVTNRHTDNDRLRL